MGTLALEETKDMLLVLSALRQKDTLRLSPLQSVTGYELEQLRFPHVPTLTY